MRYGFAFALLAVCFWCATGFKESTRLVKVKKDGTGVLHVRVLFNPALLPEQAVVFDEGKLKDAAGRYGLGVRFIAGKEIKADNGWRGYIAKYSFYDIGRLELLPDTLPDDADKGAADRRGWKFAFTKPEKADGVAILSILPRGTDPEAEGEDEEEEDDTTPAAKGGKKKAAADDDAAGTADEEEASVEVRRQLRGRRHSTYVQVEGKIVEAAAAPLAPYRSQKLSGTLVLADEQWEAMWRHPEARKLLKLDDPDIALLANRKVPGLRYLKKRLTVKFQ
jgi:hypothetical protein